MCKIFRKVWNFYIYIVRIGGYWLILKTKIVVFRKRGGLKDDDSWTYNGVSLEVVNDFNYLGTVFNYTDSFALNQEMLIGKGLKALNFLFVNTKTYALTPKVMCQLFDSFVGSILSYSCEVWGF